MKQEIKKYDWKGLFYLISIIWGIDFILTIIALNLRAGKFYETNFISAFFYSLGVLGYIINFIFCISLLFLMAFFVVKLINRLSGEKYKKRVWYIVIILFILAEGGAILNNVWRLIFY